jgi:polysaccharide pyruvyl transferase WcaK-like protein
MAYFYPKAGPWPEQDRARYDRYLQTIAGFAATTAAAGHEVLVFLSQIRNDRYALDDLLLALEGWSDQASRRRVRAEATDGLPRLLAQIAHLDVVVTSRLHGVILSYLLHKPVIALSYDPKIQAVMAQFGQEAYCLDIEQVTPDVLSERLQSLLRDRPAIERRIAATATAHRALLDRQYDRLFGPAVGDHGTPPTAHADGRSNAPADGRTNAPSTAQPTAPTRG